MIIVEYYFLLVILPLWVAAGLVDWMLHRQTHIERTSGLEESLLHVLQMVEVGLPALLVVFLKVNAAVIFCMIIGFLLHEVTGLWDVRYASTRRVVSPFEQHVHSFLEVMPLIAGTLVITLHLDQFLALLNLGPAPLDFSFTLKELPWPAENIAWILSGIIILIGGPYAEEVLRCLRFRRRLSAS